MAKSNKGFLIFAGVSVAALVALKAGSVADTAKSIQIRLTKLNVKFPKIYATLQIFNPSNNTITIDSLVGQVFFNGQLIGNIQYINKTPIAPQTYSTWDDVLIDLSAFGITTVLGNIINKQSKSGTFDVNGKVFVKGVALPFNQTMKAF